MTLLEAIEEIKRRKLVNELSINYSSGYEQLKYKIQAEVWERVENILKEVDSL